jgi:HEPN domain-containing protein
MEIDKADLELVKSFMRKAYDDLKSAEILLEKGQYSDSTFHSQQAAEKSSKALLILNKIFVREHIISQLLFNLGVNTKEIAEDALKKAKFVVNEIEKILKEKYSLDLEKENKGL